MAGLNAPPPPGMQLGSRFGVEHIPSSAAPMVQFGTRSKRDWIKVRGLQGNLPGRGCFSWWKTSELGLKAG